MVFEQSDVRQITESVWDLTFQTTLGAADQPVPKGGAVAASIDLRGTWNGTVTLVLTTELARELAGVMYNANPAQLPPSDVQDAVGELTNMVGGNLRALVPEECHLSLPRAVSSTIPDAADYALAFACQGKPFWVMVHEGA